MKKGKIPKPNKKKIGTGSIPPVQMPRSKVTFSFEFYDLSNDTFCLSKFTPTQIHKALERLSQINSNTFNELYDRRGQLHFHEVDWSRTTKRIGFTNEKAKDHNDNAWQIALLSVNSKKTRVFGVLLNDVFYIVWFDLHHKVWECN